MGLALDTYRQAPKRFHQNLRVDVKLQIGHEMAQETMCPSANTAGLVLQYVFGPGDDIVHDMIFSSHLPISAFIMLIPMLAAALAPFIMALPTDLAPFDIELIIDAFFCLAVKPPKIRVVATDADSLNRCNPAAPD